MLHFICILCMYNIKINGVNNLKVNMGWVEMFTCKSTFYCKIKSSGFYELKNQSSGLTKTDTL